MAKSYYWEYSRELEFNIHYVEFDDKILYPCPICLHGYLKDFKNSLSDEHVPPLSLGGKKMVITCCNCNNNSATIESKAMDSITYYTITQWTMIWTFNCRTLPDAQITLTKNHRIVFQYPWRLRFVDLLVHCIQFLIQSEQSIFKNIVWVVNFSILILPEFTC